MKNNGLEKKKCPVCGRNFETEYVFKIYCSPKCTSKSQKRFTPEQRAAFHTPAPGFECGWCGKTRKARELLGKYIAMSHYLTRGGFIQDCNGKWCKDGDLVRVRYDDVTNGKVGVLVFSEDKIYGFGVKTNEYKERGIYSITSTYGFELIEPCEPDICKDFEEV